MDKICSHIDGATDKLLPFKRLWLRLHPNTYKGPFVSSTSNRRQGSSKPNKSNKKRQFSDDRPSARWTNKKTKMIIEKYRPSSLGDDDRSRSEYYSHCATTAPLTDDSAKLPNTLDVSSLADTIPESANKDSENDIEGPDLECYLLQVVLMCMNKKISINLKTITLNYM
jgi:hypothetical protein